MIAAALRSELFFYLLYVLVGLQVLARLWLRRDVKQLSWRRRAPRTAFPGEPTTVEIELTNNGLLPIPWLTLTESVPPALHNPPTIREVISLGAGERHTLTYTMVGGRRGYYRLGPLSLRTGDVLGLEERTLAGPEHGLAHDLPADAVAGRARAAGRAALRHAGHLTAAVQRPGPAQMACGPTSPPMACGGSIGRRQRTPGPRRCGATSRRSHSRH